MERPSLRGGAEARSRRAAWYFSRADGVKHGTADDRVLLQLGQRFLGALGVGPGRRLLQIDAVFGGGLRGQLLVLQRHGSEEVRESEARVLEGVDAGGVGDHVVQLA